MQNSFKAGAARVDITPPLGTIINGDFTAHYAREIHDPLYAKSLVLKNEGTTIAIIVVDICAMDIEFVWEVKQAIQIQAGIPPEHVLMSSTHTHAGGSVTDLLCCPADLTYRKKLPDLIVRSVVQAVEQLRPAKIAFGSAEAPEHVVCRRYRMKPGYHAFNPVTKKYDPVKTNPAGHEDQILERISKPDTGLSFLAIKGIDEAWISVLTNYSLHYVGDWPPGTITADYFGVFAASLAEQLHAPPGFVGIMSNGTSGEINIIDYLEPNRYPGGYFEKSTLIGTDLAQKVSAALDNLDWEEEPVLSAVYLDVPVLTRKPSTAALNESLQIVSTTNFERLSLDGSHTGNDENLERIYAREQVLLNEYPDTFLFPVQALKIGSGMIGGLAGEFFAATGLALKAKHLPGKYFTICFANGYIGYVPPAHEFENGGYETWRCRTSFLDEDSEQKISEALSTLTFGFR